MKPYITVIIKKPCDITNNILSLRVLKPSRGKPTATLDVA